MKFLFFSILFHVTASIFLKYGAVTIENYNIISIISNTFYILSLFFLFLQAVTWQLTLKKYDLSYAYAFTSLYYPFILLASYFIFNEKLTVGNIAGTAFIITGIALIKNKSKVF